MIKPHPECPNSDISDRLVAADVFLRQEPDEEDDEEEDYDVIARPDFSQGFASDTLLGACICRPA